MSNNSEYLRVLAEGGDASNLPKPNSVNGGYLYQLATSDLFESADVENSTKLEYTFTEGSGYKSDGSFATGSAWLNSVEVTLDKTYEKLEIRNYCSNKVTPVVIKDSNGDIVLSIPFSEGVATESSNTYMFNADISDIDAKTVIVSHQKSSASGFESSCFVNGVEKVSVMSCKSGKALLGKKVMFLGDSITALAGERSWVEYFCNLTGATKLVNVAVPSAVLRDYSNTVYDGVPTINLQDNNVLGNQVQNIINNQYDTPDIIMIAIGTNDGLTADDTDVNTSYSAALASVDRQSYAGAFRYVNETLHNLYPKAIICWCSPIHRAITTITPLRVYGWSEALKKLTGCGGSYFIDTMRCGIISANETHNASGDYLADGLHPNKYGAMRMACFNADAVKNIVTASENVTQ